MVAAPPLPEPVCSDPDDDKFLACAVAAGAAYVVSGDRGLQAASPYGKVTVIRPRALVDTILQQEH
jgi:predicted nucleic acid-binding protein